MFPVMILALTAMSAVVLQFASNLTLLKNLLHLLQLEDYLSTRMLRAADRLWHRWVLRPDWLVLAWILGATRQVINTEPPAWFVPVNAALLTVIAVGGALRITSDTHRQKTAKKKLVMTARAKRIYFTVAILTFAPYIILQTLLFKSAVKSLCAPWGKDFYVFVLMFALLLMVERLAPFVLALSVLILKPVESRIQRGYLHDAASILLEYHPLVIGITGSYGKTGTKELLAAMLSEKYNVLKPPASHNTLMGVTRLIREQLRPFHDVLVVEMGAYQIGSIQKLCNLTRPQHGIITVIGLQHLERFGSQESIQRAKGELLRSLPSDGLAVLNGDDPRCRSIGREFSGKVIYFRVEPRGGGAPPVEDEHIPTVWARDIHIGINGSDFVLVFTDGEYLETHLSLLGRPVVANATAAAALARALGVPIRSINRALSSLPQVAHRLEAKLTENGITVIDDAFNSNPIGAESALEVLSQAVGGRRVLVTPGMVELGVLEDEANRQFGCQAARACDLAVLIGGSRIEPIKRGLLEGGFLEEDIWTAVSLTEGLTLLNQWLRPGDTMLLENDLPDQYDRK